MKIKNYYIYKDQDTLKALQEEYAILGRNTKLENGRLIVFALQKTKKVDKPQVRK